MRSDTYVHNFKHAIEAYYKGVQVSDYTKRNHFFEALSVQQRNAIGCQKIGGTYASMVKTFRRAYKLSRFDTVNEWTNIRMREGETVSAFANRFQGRDPGQRRSGRGRGGGAGGGRANRCQLSQRQREPAVEEQTR